MPLRLKPRPFQGALVPSALKNSCSSSFARSPVTAGISELMVVTARPWSTSWTSGGGSSSWLVARPERTMKGRLWTTKSEGNASIALVGSYRSMSEEVRQLRRRGTEVLRRSPIRLLLGNRKDRWCFCLVSFQIGELGVCPSRPVYPRGDCWLAQRSAVGKDVGDAG
jgi:hypothetical protein